MPNAILAIPLYFGLAFLPHFYAMRLLRRADRKAYDNSNPRGKGAVESVRKALGPEAFARWERARAAHTNGVESLPLFAATILAGLLTRLPYVGAVAVWNLAIRLLYNVLYISTTDRKRSYARSLAFFAMTGANLATLVQAGLQAV